jgi:hypothetical protein
MKIAISVASVLVSVWPLKAQIASINRLPNGSTEIRVRNSSDRSLAAFAVSVTVIPIRGLDFITSASDSQQVMYYDSAISLVTKALAPNKEHAFPGRIKCAMMPPGASLEDLRNKTIPQNCEQLELPVVTAGIFSDGSTAGNPVLLARLMLRRSNMLLAVENAREALSEAGKHNFPRNQLVDQFKRLVDSVSGWYLPPEQQVGRDLYQSIIGKLKNLPEPEFGSPFPPTLFVEEETAVLKQMRTALWDSEPSLVDGGVLALKSK